MFGKTSMTLERRSLFPFLYYNIAYLEKKKARLREMYICIYSSVSFFIGVGTFLVLFENRAYFRHIVCMFKINLFLNI